MEGQLEGILMKEIQKRTQNLVDVMARLLADYEELGESAKKTSLCSIL